MSELFDSLTLPIVESDPAFPRGHRQEVAASRRVSTLRANYTSAQTDAVIIGASDDEQIAVLGITVASAAQTTANVSVVIGFGQTATPAGAGVVAAHPGIPPGSYLVRGDGFGALGVGSSGEDLRITCGAPTGGSIDVVVTYVKQ